MLGVVALALSAFVWVVVARRDKHWLVPLYILTNAIPFFLSIEVSVYPDRGAGGLTEAFPTVGDVLLAGTVLLVPSVTRELRRKLPILLLSISAVSLTNALVEADYPSSVLVYLAVTPARMAAILAIMYAASRHGQATRRLSKVLVATMGLFFVAAVAYTVAASLDLTDHLASVGLKGGDGRLKFPTLGNNKIGLALLLLTTAAALCARPLDRNRRLKVQGFAILLGLATSLVAELRYATTAFVILLAIFLLTVSVRAAVTLFGLILAAVVSLSVMSMNGVPRALSVLSGDFSGLADSSLQSRQKLWDAAMAIWLDAPVLGSLGRWEYDRPVHEHVLRGALETHSEFLWLLASFGLAGILLIVALLWSPLTSALRQRGVALAALALSLGALALNTASYFPATAAILIMVTYAGALTSSMAHPERDSPGCSSLSDRE